MRELGAETAKFLNAMSASARATYQPGLFQFQAFLSTKEGFAVETAIRDFLKQVSIDRRLDPLEQQFVDREILKRFTRYLEVKFKPKSVRTYVGAVQSLAKFYGIEISTQYLDLPASLPASKKHPWELETAAKFIASMDDPLYQCIAVDIFQSGLGISDILALDYDAIKMDYEAGVVPFCLDLVRIKTQTPHLTFVGDLGAELLREHLGSKHLDDKTKLFEVSARAVESYFAKQALEFLGSYEGTNPMRPHSLRSAFRTLIRSAGCPNEYVEFWMGHNLDDIEKIYTSKTHDGWRAEYRKYEHAVSFDLRQAL